MKDKNGREIYLIVEQGNEYINLDSQVRFYTPGGWSLTLSADKLLDILKEVGKKMFNEGYTFEI